MLAKVKAITAPEIGQIQSNKSSKNKAYKSKAQLGGNASKKLQAASNYEEEKRRKKIIKEFYNDLER